MGGGGFMSGEREEQAGDGLRNYRLGDTLLVEGTLSTVALGEQGFYVTPGGRTLAVDRLAERLEIYDVSDSPNPYVIEQLAAAARAVVSERTP